MERSTVAWLCALRLIPPNAADDLAAILTALKRIGLTSSISWPVSACEQRAARARGGGKSRPGNDSPQRLSKSRLVLVFRFVFVVLLRVEF